VFRILEGDEELSREIVRCIKSHKNLDMFSEEISKKKFEKIKLLSVSNMTTPQHHTIEYLTEKVKETIDANIRKKKMDPKIFREVATCLLNNEDFTPNLHLSKIEKEKITPLLLSLVGPKPDKEDTPREATLVYVRKEIPRILAMCGVEEGDDGFYETVTEGLLKGKSLDTYKEEISERKFHLIENAIKGNKELIDILYPSAESLLRLASADIHLLLEELKIQDVCSKGRLSDLIVKFFIPVEDPKDLFEEKKLESILSECRDEMVPEDFEKLLKAICRNENHKKSLEAIERIINCNKHK